MNSSDTNLESQNIEIKSLKKSNKGLIIILILIILGLVSYICYDKIIMKEEKKKENYQNGEIKEVIVFNPKIISTLTDKIDLLIKNENFHNDKESWTIYTDLNLSDRTKLLIALNNSDSFQYNSYDTEKEIDYKVLRKSSIEKIYKEIWGEEIKKFKNFYYCPTYEYSTQKEEYHIFWNCGDVYEDQLVSYISKVTENEGIYYLYQSVGMVDYIHGSKLAGKLYDSVDMKNIVDESESLEYLKNFEINEDNYEQFSEYRFTFKLDNGVYKITNIERLK